MNLTKQDKRIFIHGLNSSGEGIKAVKLREMRPDIVTPTFTGSYSERMEQLLPIMETAPGWLMIGSSLGGLIATIFALQFPHKVKKLILLAPALIRYPDYQSFQLPIGIPTFLYHGKNDTIIPLDETLTLAKNLFSDCQVTIFDDDHLLHDSMNKINWNELLA